MAVGDKLSALRIKINLLSDQDLGLYDININVDNGVAVLTGDVEVEEQKNRAEQLAYEVEGVQEVDNEICVVGKQNNNYPVGEGSGAHFGYSFLETEEDDTEAEIMGSDIIPGSAIPTSEQFLGQFSDAEIEKEVTNKLNTQKSIDTSKIEACSMNQIVHLKGTVNTAEDINTLLDMIINVRGVMGIVSKVKSTND